MTPARVNRRAAMRMLGIGSKGLWRKVVDANPELVHRLPGETRAHYRVDVIVRLMAGRTTRCAAQGEGAKAQ